MASELLVEVNKYRVIGQNARVESKVHIGSISKISETVGKKVLGVPTQLFDVIDTLGRRILTTDANGVINIKNKLTTIEVNKYIVANRRARYQGKDTLVVPSEKDILRITQRSVILNNASSKVYDVYTSFGSRLVTTDQAGFNAINAL